MDSKVVASLLIFKIGITSLKKLGWLSKTPNHCFSKTSDAPPCHTLFIMRHLNCISAKADSSDQVICQKPLNLAACVSSA